MKQTQLFTNSELKMFRTWSYVLMLLSFIGMAASLCMFFISSTMISSFNRDFAFIMLLVVSTGLFFIGQLFENIGMGRQETTFHESNRRSSMRSAIYGIIASLAGSLLLIVALLVH